METVKHIAIVSVLGSLFGAVMVYWFLSHLEREGTSASDFFLEYVIAPVVLVLLGVVLLAAAAGFIVLLVWLW